MSIYGCSRLLSKFSISLTIERRLLKWTKWRSGMILRFGNVVLLTVEEVKGSLFNSRCEQMAILRENSKWEKHSADTVVYGVDVSVSVCLSVCLSVSVLTKL